MRARISVAVLIVAVACSGHGTVPPPRTVAAATFAVIGDWGAGTAAQSSIATQMCTTRQAHPYEVVVTTGDNFYVPDGVATTKSYWTPEQCLIDAHVTWRAAWGNHDEGGMSTRTLLGAQAHWYSFAEGAADVFVLDSNQTGDQAQLEWLRGALAGSRAVFKIAVFHYPPYTVGDLPGNSQARRLWVPLFRRYHVQLVLGGHLHNYEHLRVDGVDYVISGGGGGDLTPCVSTSAQLIICKAVHHFVLVDVTSTSLTVTAILADGSVLERFAVAP